MIDIPEAEALALLKDPLICIEPPDWVPNKMQPGTFQIEVGVLDQLSRAAGLLVVFHYRNSQKTKKISYKFSVFKRQPYGNDRVYQLSIEQWPIAIKDPHKRSHEHLGDQRTIGLQAWAEWNFDRVMAYFCKKTNITFKPPVAHPDHFALSGGMK